MAVAVAASLPFVYVDKLYFALGSTLFWVVVTVGAQQASHCWPSYAKQRKERVAGWHGALLALL